MPADPLATAAKEALEYLEKNGAKGKSKKELTEMKDNLWKRLIAPTSDMLDRRLRAGIDLINEVIGE